MKRIMFAGLFVLIAAFSVDAVTAIDVLKATGVKGGLVVHVGCGDGTLTAELRANGSFKVHGLDASEANVQKARAYLKSKGLYGPVAVTRMEGGKIPFIDNFATLIVVTDVKATSPAEILRVLAPGAKAYVGGKVVTKPLSPDRDEWTHYLHDASNNAVSKDKLVAPPKHMQFRAGLEWSRLHHKLASISGLVTAKGRMFYVKDSGPGGDMSVPAKWSVLARDAYNSAFLWERNIDSWSDYTRGFRSGPAQMPRLIVTDGDALYLPLAIDQPTTALDATTGKTVRTFAGSEGTEELILHRGMLLVVIGTPSPAQAQRMPGYQATTGRKVLAFTAATGEAVWQTPEIPVADLTTATLAADDTQVYFQGANGVTCLDLKTGKQVWGADSSSSESAETSKVAASDKKKDKKDKKKDKKKKSKKSTLVDSGTSNLVVKDGVVLSVTGKHLKAYSAKDGSELWSGGSGISGFKSPGDIFVINGEVWLGNAFTQALDLHTGKVVKESSVLNDIQTSGHHHRCYREKATERYIMAGYRGIEYMDLQGNDHARNNWIRGLCQYGVMPANGLTYAPPHSCGCYMEAKLYGFWAVSAEREGFKIDNTNNPLEKGPAYGKTKGAPGKDDWPTMRGTIKRSGTTAMKLPAKLSPGWKTKLGTRLTAPVAANGLVLVADKDAHTVFAIDAATGTVKWSFIAGGPVDTPPTIHNGAAIFGSHDGWVYSLRLTDGVLAWRFRAAPADYLTMNMNQVESVWPVFGSVLVQNGLIYCAAGHNSYLDGGIFMYTLDPATGAVAHRERFDSERPKIYTTPDQKSQLEAKYPEQKISQNRTDYRTFASADKSDSFSISGATMNDVVSGDGKNVFLRHLTYGADWKLKPNKEVHLFSTSHLTDDNENHRSHWVIGRGFFGRTIYAYPWIPERFMGDLFYPVGLMFAFEGMESWGIHRMKGDYHYALFQQTIPNIPEDSGEYTNDLAREKGVNTWTWSVNPEFRPRAILKAGGSVVVGGMPLKDEDDPFAALEGRKGGVVKVFNAKDGSVISENKIDSPVMWDGLAAANGKLYASLQDGSIICLE